METRPQVSIGLIFMDPENYPKFEKTLESIFRNRYFRIDFILIDNRTVMHSRQPFEGPRRVLASIVYDPLR
jgi:alpha-ketoglutarate-dependent taurine dioxygenase